MNVPQSLLYPHITIDEVNSLTTDEKDLLLIICNIWAPIHPPMPSPEDPYPITLNIIRATKREAILDRVIQAEKIIKDEAKEVYSGLRYKLNIPLPPPPSVEPPTVIVNEPNTVDTGSIKES